MPDLKVTPAVSWKKQPELVQLPSGKVVAAKEVDVMGLILNSPKGDVPDFLRIQMNAKLNGKRQGSVIVDGDNLNEVSSLMGLVVQASVVEPRIVRDGANYERGEINLDDLATEDKMYIFNLVIPAQEMDTAKSFRERIEAANLAIIRGMPADGQQTEPIAKPA